MQRKRCYSIVFTQKLYNIVTPISFGRVGSSFTSISNKIERIEDFFTFSYTSQTKIVLISI
ncbi:hypothetical protein MEM_01260 [Candida albicans L26]|uniref:Uncharacterized protein n=1 Tax=Candida albicans P78048 TaxID=1094989 RepID=A0AB34PXJ8_CANAX|nr:hypothetical protein MEU_01255 [Candida albicans P37005]KGR16573.1 hypothetical protein MG3_01302 [Candida albicans P78048]KGR22916.1 hypothetical protein MG9_01254 [Candida albicans P37037]KGT71731.1 hypothetical protein MEK_01279 [Candida albicans 12C]KGU16851.1 hypothetical protein MEY_01255 [Candida albicans 19F]KGU17216.1 hypothetical protein MEM_01260 [Candida albicans L26]KHC88901.1 hypothetical protein I503_01271 [Candida albicans SC5314]